MARTLNIDPSKIYVQNIMWDTDRDIDLPKDVTIEDREWKYRILKCRATIAEYLFRIYGCYVTNYEYEEEIHHDFTETEKEDVK